MSGPKNSSAAIREVWNKEGRQRWDGQTHGRGLGLLIVDALVAQGTLMLGRLKSPHQTFEFWRDQNKIRGRFIGFGKALLSPDSLKTAYPNENTASASASTTLQLTLPIVSGDISRTACPSPLLAGSMSGARSRSEEQLCAAVTSRHVLVGRARLSFQYSKLLAALTFEHMWKMRPDSASSLIMNAGCLPQRAQRGRLDERVKRGDMQLTPFDICAQDQ